MICPVASPSAANAKMSGAHWLDRLRSSRGFPPADDVDLCHFLAAQSSASAAASADPPSQPNPPAAADSRGCETRRQLGERMGENVADILCELFIMGGGGGGGGRGRGEASNCESSKRKSSRKQQNPKFWDATGSSKKSSNDCFSDDLRRENDNNNLNSNNNGLASSGDNSLNRHREERDSKSVGELGFGVETEEEVDLKGYSKSEVTVIDSSIQGWRSEIFVFRKRKNKSVWKVREKKSKSRSLTSVRRKRKSANSNSSDKDDDDEKRRKRRRRKKKKKKKKIMRVSDGKEDAMLPLINQMQGQFRDDKVEQPLDRVALLHGEGPIKSFPCSNSHWKLKSQASSVILVRPISAFDKIGTGTPEKLSVNQRPKPTLEA